MIKKTHGYTDNELQLSCGPCSVCISLPVALLAACSDPGEKVSSEVSIVRPFSLSLSFITAWSDSEDVLQPDKQKKEVEKVNENKEL
jgi:hypothetical protein